MKPNSFLQFKLPETKVAPSDQHTLCGKGTKCDWHIPVENVEVLSTGEWCYMVVGLKMISLSVTGQFGLFWTDLD